MNAQSMSVAMIGGASAINVAGAVLNTMHLRIAFTLWIFSNAVCALYFYGAQKHWWNAEQTGERSLMVMYLVFLGTATYGYLN